MTDRYENPLSKRYASKTMQSIFSDENKFRTWRTLWVALAESQKELGLEITDEQIQEMKAYIDDINFDAADKYERETRHDVMAHIKAYGDQCPKAKPIIHLGATSCYVGDNTDLILQRAALQEIKKLLINTISVLYDFVKKHKSQPCLAYTHFQPAQPTTLGKRASLWLHDLIMDFEQLNFTLGGLKMLGCRGTTGTAASFLALFNGDKDKTMSLERKIAQKMGFDTNYATVHGYVVDSLHTAGLGIPSDAVYAVSGQTYTRKVDYYTLSVLSGIAQSAYKFSNDIRLMSHLKEIDEPFEDGQVGSSAMPYKRNPMRSERIASLARHVTVGALNPALTASAQWMERTLDDSANRRIAIPEAFMAVDAILSLMMNVVSGMTVYPGVIKKHLDEELPFMATENILMYCVMKGGDRQELHERLREHSVETARRIKQDGADNDLIEKILADPVFKLTKEEIKRILFIENFTGMAEEQTEHFLQQVKVLLKANKKLLGTVEVSIRV